jgi:hypothetical protein
MVVLEEWLVCGSRDALGDQTLLLAKHLLPSPHTARTLEFRTRDTTRSYLLGGIIYLSLHTRISGTGW